MKVKQTKQKNSMSKSALRRQREKELRYQTILDAAARLFAENGYHQTSVEQIADEAEVSTGAVYFYFKNKADVLIRLIEDIGLYLRKRVGEEFIKHGSTIEGFKEAGLVYFREFSIKHPEKVALIFRESAGQGPEVEAVRKKIFDKLTADIKGALVRITEKKGLVLKDDTSIEVIAVSIIGIYERVVYHYQLSQNPPEDIMTIGEDAVSFLIGGVEKLLDQHNK